jgi:zinc transport system substrate-binding protein
MGLDAELQNLVAGKQSLAVIASHPVYQYMARRYALNLTSVTWEPDQFPTEAQWRRLAKLANEQGAGWMIWEGTPLSATEDRLSQMGINSVVFDPCANVPDDGDFIEVMRQNIENLKAVYR